MGQVISSYGFLKSEGRSQNNYQTFSPSPFPLFLLLFPIPSIKKMLNRLIQPSQHFHLTIGEIAKLLHIPPNIILRIELWAYIIFVHRSDRGGQFVSYRKLEKWKNAVACQIQKCTTHKQLDNLWDLIEKDRNQYSKQYKVEAFKAFIKKVWNKQWDKLSQAMAF